MQFLTHYFLHLVFPVIIAYLFFKKDWKKVSIILLSTMLIDLDHLLATPIFDPMRCSIGYHPLHSFFALAFYVVLLLIPSVRIIAIGLILHILTDTIDCLWTFSHCHECYLKSHLHF